MWPFLPSLVPRSCASGQSSPEPATEPPTDLQTTPQPAHRIGPSSDFTKTHVPLQARQCVPALPHPDVLHRLHRPNANSRLFPISQPPGLYRSAPILKVNINVGLKPCYDYDALSDISIGAPQTWSPLVVGHGSSPSSCVSSDCSFGGQDFSPIGVNSSHGLPSSCYDCQILTSVKRQGSKSVPHQQLKPRLYKTEACRNFEERGTCDYGTKCQFAHGPKELRPIARHPKWKTERCRTFWEQGSCPYAKRCCFLHEQAPPVSVKPLESELIDQPPLLVRLRSQSTGSLLSNASTTEAPASFRRTRSVLDLDEKAFDAEFYNDTSWTSSP